MLVVHLHAQRAIGVCVQQAPVRPLLFAGHLVPQLQSLGHRSGRLKVTITRSKRTALTLSDGSRRASFAAWRPQSSFSGSSLRLSLLRRWTSIVRAATVAIRHFLAL